MRWIFAMAGALWACAPVLAQSNVADPGQQLAAIYQSEWEWWKLEMAEEPDDERPGEESDHLARVDEASQQARLAHLQAVLADVNRISTVSLSSEEKINAEIFRTLLEERISDLRFKTYQAPFNADSFFWTDFTPREGFPDQDAYRRYLGRLADVPRFHRR